MSDTENTAAVSLSLNGETSEIDALAVASAIENLAKLVSGFGSQTGKIKLAELREGSAVAGVIVTEETKSQLLSGLEEIRARKTIPKTWTYEQMKTLRRITDLRSGRGANSVSLISGSVTEPMDEALRDSIEKALSRVISSIGSVTGELYRYAEKKSGFEAALHHELTGKSVVLSFGEEAEAKVRQLLRKRVEVWGILQRHPHTNEVERVTLRGIEEVKRPTELVSGYGIWKNLDFGGKTAEQLIREMRDGE